MRGRGAADHAEVEEGEVVVLRDEDVAGVRIGVEEAGHEDLVQVRLEELVGQRGPVHLEARERAQRRDLAFRARIPS